MSWRRLFTKDDGECAILTVHAEHKDYAVAAPLHEACVGHLCEFRVADNMTMVGKVTHLMHCKQFDNVWDSVSVFTRIHDAVEIYDVVWSETDNDT